MHFIRQLVKTVRPQASEVITNEVSETVTKELSKGQYIVTTGNCFTVVNAVGKVTEVICKLGQVVSLSDVDIKCTLDYFFRKCTSAIKHFLDKNVYEKISEERKGILYYTSRILPSQEFGGNLSLSDVMIDLTYNTFTVPLVEYSSPFTFSIVNEVHWLHPVAKHSGNDTVWRYTMKYAHIIEGRDLVRSSRKERKVFEKLMRSQITGYVEKYLSPFLCGYCKGYSPQHALSYVRKMANFTR